MGSTKILSNSGMNAVKVFSGFFDCLKKFINDINPKIFIFLADKKEPSRIRLYDKMIKRFSSGYKISFEEDEYYKTYVFKKKFLGLF